MFHHEIVDGNFQIKQTTKGSNFAIISIMEISVLINRDAIEQNQIYLGCALF